MPSVTQSSRTLSEAITKKGRCSVFHQRPFDVFATTGCCRVFASGQWVIYRVFRKCGEKSETSEHKPNFGNKTAGRGCLKQGPSRQISVFHRTSGNARRKYAANFGTLEHIAVARADVV